MYKTKINLWWDIASTIAKILSNIPLISLSCYNGCVGKIPQIKEAFSRFYWNPAGFPVLEDSKSFAVVARASPRYWHSNMDRGEAKLLSSLHTSGLNSDLEKTWKTKQNPYSPPCHEAQNSFPLLFPPMNIQFSHQFLSAHWPGDVLKKCFTTFSNLKHEESAPENSYLYM